MGFGAALNRRRFIDDTRRRPYGLARRGLCKGDVFAVGAILLTGGLIALFVYGVLHLSLAFRDNDGSFALALFAHPPQNVFSPAIWSFDCVFGT